MGMGHFRTHFGVADAAGIVEKPASRGVTIPERVSVADQRVQPNGARRCPISPARRVRSPIDLGVHAVRLVAGEIQKSFMAQDNVAGM